MKRFLTTLSIICVFLFGVGSLAGASNTSKKTLIAVKSSILNSLKNIHSHLMHNGHLVRLEFKKPVSQWMKPVFYEKSMEIVFPGAFVLYLRDVRPPLGNPGSITLCGGPSL